MRNFLLLILILATLPVLGQRPESKIKLSVTEKEKLNYVLSIDHRKISKVRDTTFGDKKKWSYVTAQVRLSNLSNDTLVYINMTCSKYDIFVVNNKYINIRGWGCDVNLPDEYRIPPHKYSTFNFSLFFAKDHPSQKFRFGIYLIRPKTAHWRFGVMKSFWKSKNPFKDCLIWSNEITIAKP